MKEWELEEDVSMEELEEQFVVFLCKELEECIIHPSAAASGF